MPRTGWVTWWVGGRVRLLEEEEEEEAGGCWAWEGPCGVGGAGGDAVGFCGSPAMVFYEHADGGGARRCLWRWDVWGWVGGWVAGFCWCRLRASWKRRSAAQRFSPKIVGEGFKGPTWANCKHARIMFYLLFHQSVSVIQSFPISRSCPGLLLHTRFFLNHCTLLQLLPLRPHDLDSRGVQHLFLGHHLARGQGRLARCRGQGLF